MSFAEYLLCGLCGTVMKEHVNDGQGGMKCLFQPTLFQSVRDLEDENKKRREPADALLRSLVGKTRV